MESPALLLDVGDAEESSPAADVVVISEDAGEAILSDTVAAEEESPICECTVGPYRPFGED